VTKEGKDSFCPPPPTNPTIKGQTKTEKKIWKNVVGRLVNSQLKNRAVAFTNCPSTKDRISKRRTPSKKNGESEGEVNFWWSGHAERWPERGKAPQIR